MTSKKSDIPRKKKARVFIVDDHAVMRHGVRRLIEEEPDLEVCGEAADAHHALELIASSKPDAAIIDIGLKGMGGLDLIKNLKQRFPKLPVLTMSMHDESLYAERALRAGAKGYLMKEEPGEKVLEALRRILSGKVYVSEKMAERMLDKISGGASTENATPVDVLSDRELDVFRLIGKGFKNSAIADSLHIGVKTVEFYREQIKEKLKLENASAVAQYAIAWLHSEPQ